MERRDFLLDQIEQLGKVLGKILEGFFNQKEPDKINEAAKTAEVQLKEQLDIDVKRMLSATESELANYVHQRKLKAEHLDVLANYFNTIAVNSSSLIHYQTALSLLNIADNIAKTTTFERIAFVEKLKESINNLKK
jgi:hypothetical protein